MTNSINEAVQNTFSELDKGLRGVVTTIEDNIDNILFELSTSTGSISFRVIYTNKKVTVDLVESTITDLDVSMIILQKLKTLETHEYIPGYFFIRLKSQ